MKRATVFKIAAAALALLLAGAAFFAVWHWQQGGKAPEAGSFYQQGEHWAEGLGETDLESAGRFAQKLLKLKTDLFPTAGRVFCAVIPDKAYYLQQGQNKPFDYAALLGRVNEGLAGSGITTIDLTGALTLNDYYTTDSHWRQERLQPVLDTLGKAMGFEVSLAGWQPNTVEGFIGAYGKGGATMGEPLTYLTSSVTEAALADNYQAPDVHTVYDTARLSTDVPYDVFLSGATPLVTIESPGAATDKELVIFRDSYASSLAPLLLAEYRTITLVDIRYMVSGLVPQYVTFENQDVLFLYSTFLVNQSAMLR